MAPTQNLLLAEILEQPKCLEELLENYSHRLKGLQLPGMYTQKIIGIAEGSSYNALKIAAPFIEEYTGLNNFTFDPESLENKFEIARELQQPAKRLFEKSFFLTVSQSGETGSVLSVLNNLQETLGFADQHAPILSVTNNPESNLPQRYHNNFDIKAGPEKSIAATKSLTASIMALLLFGIRCGQKRSWQKRSFYQQMLFTLSDIPDTLSHYLENPSTHEKLKQFAKVLGDSNQFVILSKGILSLVLPEAGLKLTETSKNIVWTDNTESFKHGRKVILGGIQGVTPNTLYVIPPDLQPNQAESFFNDIYQHFFVKDTLVFSPDNVFLIRFKNSPKLPKSFSQAMHVPIQHILELPESQGISSLFLTIIVFQLISCYLAEVKGENPNNPTLQKAVLE